jgi:hypothetical protein
MIVREDTESITRSISLSTKTRESPKRNFRFQAEDSGSPRPFITYIKPSVAPRGGYQVCPPPTAYSGRPGEHDNPSLQTPRQT